MIRRLLPEEVAVAEVFGDLSEPPLFPEEAVVARSVDRRRREFATGRRCAAGRATGPAVLVTLR